VSVLRWLHSIIVRVRLLWLLILIGLIVRIHSKILLW
jgi:hypothetical protein